MIGVLPDMRVGLSRFENNMMECGFEPRDVSNLLNKIKGSASDERFLCSGGDTKNYRVVLWGDRSIDQDREERLVDPRSHLT